jgi:nicotinate phosphoribosyltransferase
MMTTPIETIGLYTDFYELSMAQGYFLAGKKEEPAIFEYFFRTNPYQGGFTVYAGLRDFLEGLRDFRFSASDLTYLQSLGLNASFLDYLRDFSFRGIIYSMQEGEVVFPNEPVLCVEGTLIECQLIESFLLNILNFESLIATKAFRVWLASGGRPFSDFGLRRAQGFGALHGSRAAVIGGASSTSNVLAGKHFKIPVSGTQAHSWIQSFDSELEAFRTYARNHPENTTLLVDTYDTLKSGVPNAITVAREMEAENHKLKAVRLDSGDLAFLSKKTRNLLDAAGLFYVRIIASNQLNEWVIQSLIHEQHAPIDAFGVGTELITGKPDAALDGVYKLTSINNLPKMKVSENPEKTTLPGQKTVRRYFHKKGKFFCDGILLKNQPSQDPDTLYNPSFPEKSTRVTGLKPEELLTKAYAEQTILWPKKNPAEIFLYLKNRADKLPQEYKRFIHPPVYEVGISKDLLTLRNKLSDRYIQKS